jgi:glycosyltransferase involved in cell wall biosynthesis
MRVLINGVAALRPKTGIGHYIEGLCEEFESGEGSDAFALFPNSLARKLVRRLFRPRPPSGKPAPPAPNATPASWRAFSLRFAQRLGSLAFRRAFRSAASGQGFNLYHEPNYIPWRCDLPALATVHDLSVLLYPEWHPAERVKHFDANFYRGLRRCVHLIADSHCVRREIIDKLGVPPERVTTVHLGVRPTFRPLTVDEVQAALQGLDLKPGYLLHVGTIEPRKNLLRLMQAYCDLPRPLRERHPLALVGGWGWRNQPIREYYESTARHAGVVKLGYVPEENLPALYNGARALVFPSHYEGFGFPPLEMLACGGAVLASTAGSVREIMPPGQALLAPEDVAGWRNQMRTILEDDDYWVAARRGGVEHAQAFTWRRCAEETRAVYRKVA